MITDKLFVWFKKLLHITSISYPDNSYKHWQMFHLPVSNFKDILSLYVSVYVILEPEDEDVDKAREILLQPAVEEHNKGEQRDLFFFIGADVSGMF